MRKSFASIILLFVASIAFSQPNRFQKLLAEFSNNASYVTDVMIAEPNKYIIYSDKFLVCTDSMGSTQWVYEYPHTRNPFQEIYLGNNTVALLYYSTEQSGFKTTENIGINCVKDGVELWNRSFKVNPAADEGSDYISKDGQNNIIIISHSIVDTDYSQYVLKLSATDGSTLSTNKVPLVSGFFVRSVLTDKADNTYLFMSNSNNTQTSMLVLDAAGNFSPLISLDAAGGVFSSCILDNGQIALLIYNGVQYSYYHFLINKDGSTVVQKQLPKSARFVNALPGNNLLYSGEVYYPGLTKYEAGFYFTNTAGDVYQDIRYPALMNGLLQPDITEKGELVFLLLFNKSSYDNNTYLFKTDTNGKVYDDADFSEVIYTDPTFDCFVDADRDGDYDALVRKDIFLNDGTGDFGNTRANSYSQGFYGLLFWEDIDNDFDQDLYNSTTGSYNKYFLNDKNVLKADSIMNDPSKVASAGAFWMDVNKDGYADMLLYQKNSARLYLNNGNSKFDVIPGQQFLFDQSVNTHRWVDIDNDADMDLFILIGEYSTKKGFFYRNNGKGKFTDETNFYSFLTDPVNGNLLLDFIDLDNNQTMDLIISKNYSTSLYSNDGHGNFTFKKDLPNLYEIITFADYDNDGDTDILTGNAIATVLYRNDGYLRFSNNLYIGGAIQEILDYNNDGNLDLIYLSTGYEGVIHKNAGNDNHWVNIQLKGNISTGSGLGAVVKVKAAINPLEKIWQTQIVSSGNPLHFGLGKASIIDSIIILWPSGCIEKYKMISPNTLLTYTEPCSGINPKRIDTAVCGTTFSYNQLPSESSFNWYTSLNATTPFYSGNALEVTDITNDTLVFVANTDGQMEGRRMPVFIRKKTVPTSDFTYIAESYGSNHTSVQFTSTAVNYDSLKWYFGDSPTPSTLRNPEATFSNDKNGILVHLVSYSICGKDSITKIVQFDNKPLSITMINNPVKSGSSLYFTMNETQQVRIFLYSYSGQLIGEVLNEDMAPGEYNILIPDILQDKMLPGLYIITLYRGNDVETIKIIK